MAAVSLLSRSAAGVIVMRLPEGQYVANFTRVAKEEEKDDIEDIDETEAETLIENEAEIVAEVDVEDDMATAEENPEA